MNDPEQHIKFEEGVFKQFFLDFIHYQQSLGYKYGNSSVYILHSINRDLNALHLTLEQPSITKPIVELLLEKHSHETGGSRAYRIGLLRQFSLYLNRMGFDAYVVPKRLLPRYRSDFRPYIFSVPEIAAILRTSNHLKPRKQSPKFHLIYPALLRVLYGCGLRISEARNLKTYQVDLEQGLLDIDKAKNGTRRYVPMSGSLTEYLRYYVREAQIDLRREGYFFPAPTGGPYDLKTLFEQIKKIYQKAHIETFPNGKLPRVHDLRHTFSVHALRQMKSQGQDLYTATPLLSVYLGHTNLVDTEKYIHLTAFEFGHFVADAHQVLTGVIPEVFTHETE